MALKKPTRKKFPKSPKANASAEVWQKYRDKIAEIQSDYAIALAKYEKDKKIVEKAKEDVKDMKAGKKPSRKK